MLAKAHLVQDEWVAGSNPATLTSFLSLPKAHPDRYPERYAGGGPRDPARINSICSTRRRLTPAERRQITRSRKSTGAEPRGHIMSPDRAGRRDMRIVQASRARSSRGPAASGSNRTAEDRRTVTSAVARACVAGLLIYPLPPPNPVDGRSRIERRGLSCELVQSRRASGKWHHVTGWVAREIAEHERRRANDDRAAGRAAGTGGDRQGDRDGAPEPGDMGESGRTRAAGRQADAQARGSQERRDCITSMPSSCAIAGFTRNVTVALVVAVFSLFAVLGATAFGVL
jgi:hypothetical protein